MKTKMMKKMMMRLKLKPSLIPRRVKNKKILKDNHSKQLACWIEQPLLQLLPPDEFQISKLEELEQFLEVVRRRQVNIREKLEQSGA